MCHSLYVGPSGQSLRQRYLEHIQYIKHNNPQSVCALHIIQNVREYGPLQDAMTLLQHTNKGVHMNMLEQFYIQLCYH